MKKTMFILTLLCASLGYGMGNDQREMVPLVGSGSPTLSDFEAGLSGDNRVLVETQGTGERIMARLDRMENDRKGMEKRLRDVIQDRTRNVALISMASSFLAAVYTIHQTETNIYRIIGEAVVYFANCTIG